MSDFDVADKIMADAIAQMREAGLGEQVIASAFVLKGLDHVVHAFDCSLCQAERLASAQALISRRLSELLEAIHPTGSNQELVH